MSLIQQSEGLRTTAYRDAVGIPTVCYGHTGPEVRVGQKYTLKQCDDLLVQDIKKHKAGLDACVKRRLNQNESDALLSLAFNVGDSKVCHSTLVKYINDGQTRLAADEFVKWDKATVGGKTVSIPGLRERRSKERTLFLSSTPPSAPPLRYLLTNT